MKVNCFFFFFYRFVVCIGLKILFRTFTFRTVNPCANSGSCLHLNRRAELTVVVVGLVDLVAVKQVCLDY